MEAQVHRFGSLGLYFIIYQSLRSSVICLNWGGRLWMSHFYQYLPKVYCFSCIQVKCSDFCFRR